MEINTLKAIGFVLIIAGLCFLCWFLTDSQTETNKGKVFNKTKELNQLVDYDEIENDYKLN